MSIRKPLTVYGDLFHLAAQYLGDATQAVRLAEANRLRDFVLPGLTQLVIPQVDASQTGGVPQAGGTVYAVSLSPLGAGNFSADFSDDFA